MIDKDKLESFALLMAYNSIGTIEKNIELMKKDGAPPLTIKTMEAQYEKNKKYLRLVDFTDDEVLDWDELANDLYNFYLEIISEFGGNGGARIANFMINKLRLPNSYPSLSLISKRLDHIIGKAAFFKILLEGIIDNYHDLQKNFKDLELYGVNFHNVYFKEYNKTARKFASERSKQKQKEHLKNRYELEYKKTRFILDNLPHPLMNKFSNVSETRIEGYFKQQIISQASVYIDRLNLSDRKKHILLGLCFVFAGLSDNQEDFYLGKKNKDRHYENYYPDFLEYLRDEGYNAITASKSGL